MKVDRNWGYYKVLDEISEKVKVKELVVNPHSCLSMQRHSDRSEIWFVAEGEATLFSLDTKTTDVELIGNYQQFQTLFINQHDWHQLCNETDEILRIVEIQFGDRCVEDDIERL